MCRLHRWAHMHRFLSVCLWLDQNSWTIIHISKSIAPRVMRFGQGMGVGDPEVDLKGQDHGSKVKVTRLKNMIPVSIDIFIGQCIKVKVTWVEVKGHLGQGQRSLGSRPAKHSRYWQVGSHQRQVAFFINYPLFWHSEIHYSLSIRYLPFQWTIIH